MKYINLINERINKLPDAVFVILMSFLSFIIYILYMLVNNTYGKYFVMLGNPSIPQLNIYLRTLVLIILGPILQTGLIVEAIRTINSIKKIHKESQRIFFAGIEYGIIYFVLSYFNILSGLMNIIDGWILSYSFLMYKNKRFSSYSIILLICSIRIALAVIWKYSLI